MNNSQESMQCLYRVGFMCLLQEEISGCQCTGCATALWLCKVFFFNLVGLVLFCFLSEQKPWPKDR